MSNNCTRSIQQQRVFWEVLSSHVVPPGWSHCWWCRLCQELHPLEAPGHLPHLGSAISSVPLLAVCWFGIGQVMSCAPAPLGTHGTVATGCWAPSGLPTADMDLCYHGSLVAHRENNSFSSRPCTSKAFILISAY